MRNRGKPRKSRILTYNIFTTWAYLSKRVYVSLVLTSLFVSLCIC